MKMRFWIISAAFVLSVVNNGQSTDSSKAKTLPKPQLAKRSVVIGSAASASSTLTNRKQQTPKSRGLDQVAASSGRNARQSSSYSQTDKEPKSYSHSYDSGPQYYEVTSKPVRYYKEYHSPPSSYSHSYNTGPQGYSHRSAPQQSSHRNSYNHQDGNEYRDGDSSSTGDHQTYGDDSGDEYGASNYDSNDNEYENNDQGGYNDGDSIEY